LASLSDGARRGGAGSASRIDSAQQHDVGSSVWGSGPTAVLVYMKGPILADALASSVWSFEGTHGPGGNSYTNFLAQPFFNFDRRARRSKRNGPGSTIGLSPETISAIRRPAPGPMPKPWPEKPLAK
jgi:hypothetical protein